MSDKLFDEFIKDKLKEHTAAVPADMWERIQRGKEKKGGIYWRRYLAIFLIMLITAGTVAYFRTSNFNDKVVAENIDGQQNGKPAIGNRTGARTEAATGVNNLKISDLSTKNAPSDNNAARVDVGDRGDNMNADDKAASRVIQKKFFTTEGRGSGRVTKSVDKTSSNPITPSFNNSSLSAENVAPLFETERAFKDRLSLLAMLNKDRNAFSFSTPDKLSFRPQSSVDCPTNKRGNRSIYVELFGSPDFAIKKTEANGRTNPDYVNSKDSTESRQVSYTVGLRLSKSIGENMLFKTGIQFSQINQKFTYRHENERTRTTVVTVRTIIRSPGDTIFVTDTSVIEQIGYRAKTSYNRYRSIDVPLILGYEFAGEDWKAQINGGAIINLSSWQQGEFLDTSYQATSFATTKEPIFKKKIGLGLYAGFSFIKSFGEKTDWFAEPYIRYNLSSITGDASPFNQRFHVAGINLGIRYKLK